MKTTTNDKVVREHERHLFETVCQPYANAAPAHRACKRRDRITCINDDVSAGKAFVQDGRKHARERHIEYIGDGWARAEQEFRKAQNRSELITRTVGDMN